MVIKPFVELYTRVFTSQKCLTYRGSCIQYLVARETVKKYSVTFDKCFKGLYLRENLFRAKLSISQSHAFVNSSTFFCLSQRLFKLHAHVVYFISFKQICFTRVSGNLATLHIDRFNLYRIRFRSVGASRPIIFGDQVSFHQIKSIFACKKL